MSVTIKSAREMDLMRGVGRILAIIHEESAKIVRPGMSTMDINRLGEEITRSYGCIPSLKNYDGYLASIYVSANGEVVHGISSKKRILQEGDIVSLDAGVIYRRFYSDATKAHTVKEISQEAEKFIEVTKQSFFEGIKYAKPGNRLNDISSTIAAYAEKLGYSVVRDLVGHGIDSRLHEDPEIPNSPQRREGIRLQAGMTLAIEPTINAGCPDVEWLDDGWAVITEDGSLSAHYENTALVCDDGLEILLMLFSDDKSPPPAFGEEGWQHEIWNRRVGQIADRT